MARAFSDHLGASVTAGLIAGPRTQRDSSPAGFEWHESGHPDPNAASVEAGRRALAIAAASAPDGVLVLLLSGGASAMLAAPADGITLEDKIRTARRLMAEGASIHELNCVRKHLSAIKGGQLGAAAARSVTLAISDVHHPLADDPSVIGSGPTVPDPTTFADALGVIQGVGEIPVAVSSRLQRGARRETAETIKPGDPRLASASFTVIGNRMDALRGAVRAAEALDYDVVMLPEPTRGEAREAAASFIASARSLAASAGRPLCLLATGETTVHVRGRGTGGRNQEFALAAVPFIGAFGRAAVLASAGTDGMDGPTDAAGALADSTSLERSQRAGLDWRASLADNDAYPFFRALHDLIVWGPTGTNTGDVQVMLLA
jgi:hydroxypyruvate reductase